jgi:DNA repair exonuclease SbcCD nuclease subunit
MADGFRFIHAADIHLDSPLRGLSRYEGIPEDIVRAAPREAFRNLIDRAVQEKVDFVIFAGDVLDGDIRDVNTGIFMVRQFARLERVGIPVFMLKGNHDAASELSQTIQWPPNVHEFSHRKAESFSLPELRVELHGQSFKQPEVLDDLAAHYPAPEPGYFNIGVLHTGLEGKTKHKGYARRHD